MLKYCWALSGGEVVPTSEADIAQYKSEVADGVFARARLLSRAVTAICDDKLRPFGISSMQYALLAAICREPITRAQIARLQQLSKSTLTRDLKAILFAGLIQEVRENADGRSRPVALTTAGKELLLKAQPAWLAGQAQAAALLGRDGVNALTSITDRIRHQLTRRQGKAIMDQQAAPLPSY
jgi:DNA-binding MarR family transcriptional regulator